jgi:hypothetical protein
MIDKNESFWLMSNKHSTPIQITIFTNCFRAMLHSGHYWDIVSRIRMRYFFQSYKSQMKTPQTKQAILHQCKVFRRNLASIAVILIIKILLRPLTKISFNISQLPRAISKKNKWKLYLTPQLKIRQTSRE